MTERFEGKVAFVTGAAIGMGAEHARGIVREGGSVVIADIREEAAKRLADSLGPRAKHVRLDITDEEQWQLAVELAEQLFGRIDILVNNAAVLLTGSIDSESPKQYRRILEVNLTGAFLGMRTISPKMRATRSGCIINIASVAALVGFPNSVGYCSAKWGLRGLTKAAALDLAGTGVRVNLVCPGPIDTPMNDVLDSATRQALCGGLPIPRMGSPSEVSRVVLFLASDEASYCTGGEYSVDGGANLGSTSFRPQTFETERTG